MNLWSAIKGLLVGAASLVLLASDALGIQHSTVAKTIAGAILAALAGDAVAKNDTGSKAAKKLLDGTDSPPPPR